MMSSSSYIKLATILGFNVLDDFESVPKRYRDNAEVTIFDSFLQMVSQWGLIFNNLETKKVEITSLGYKALTENKKYRFYTGKKNLFENFGIKPFYLISNLFFPHYLAFGLHSDITDCKIPFEKIDISEVFDKKENELIKRHNLQSKTSYNIFESALTKYFIVDRCEIDIRLYKNENEYFPIIFYNNQVCVEATDLLFNFENANLKEKKIEWGLYLKLIKDSKAVLSFEAIFPFEDLLDLDSLIKDARLVWTDEKLFEYITRHANGNQWHSIFSNHCPIDVIKLHIEKYYENWDWNSLSLRIDDKYLLDNAIKFPWNFEAISSKENLGIEILKILLIIPELKKQEWDWDNIMPKLDFDFIKSNIEEIDFELSELTKTTAYDKNLDIIQAIRN